MQTPSNRTLYQEAHDISTWLTPVHAPPQLKSSYQLKAGVSEDQAAGAVSGTDGSTLPELGPLAKFENWSSVAATILYKASTTAQWDPSKTNFNAEAWSAYLSKVATIPFFLTTDAKAREVSISSTSLKGTIDSVDDVISAITTGSVLTAVIESIKKIATVAIENEGKEQKDNQQTQGLLSIKASQLYVGCFWSSVVMISKKGKGYEQLNQSIQIRRFYGVLDFAKCKRHADTIMDWDGEGVGDWGKKTSSAGKSPNTSPAWNV